MNLIELYKQVPLEKHHEILISGDRLFFEGEEYLISEAGELKLMHSDKELLQRVDQISAKLGISK